MGRIEKILGIRLIRGAKLFRFFPHDGRKMHRSPTGRAGAASWREQSVAQSGTMSRGGGFFLSTLLPKTA